MKLGLIGLGKQGQRYLMRENGGSSIRATATRLPDGDAGGGLFDANGKEIRTDYRHDDLHVFLHGVDAVIIATPPATHKKLAMRCLEAGRPVLVEKPLALDLAACERLLDASVRLGVPLMVAHTHLWARGFLELTVGSPHASVVWCGPARADGSCPARLDWGPHAYSMGEALQTPHVVSRETPERVTLAMSRKPQWLLDQYYAGNALPGEYPMAAMVGTFERVAAGGTDWRADVGFTRRVYRRLFGAVTPAAQSPASPREP